MAGKHRGATGGGDSERLVVKISPVLKHSLASIAAAHERSLAGEIRVALAAYVATQRK